MKSKILPIVLPIVLILFFLSVPVSAQLMDSAWAKSHHDLNNTGQSPYPSNSNGTLKWSYVTGSQIRSSVVVDTGGILYFGGVDKKFYALYPNGTQKWNITFSSEVYSTPAIDSDGIIYVAEWSNILHAIYKDNGTEKWNVSTANNVFEGLSIDSSGIIYIPTGTGIFKTNYLYAVYPNGTIKWNFAKNWLTYSTPAIDSDGIIYIGTHGALDVYAIYPNGTQKWAIDVGTGFGYSSPLILEGILYIGGSDNKLHAIYKENGTERWSFLTGGDVFSSPAPAPNLNDVIYVGSTDWKLYAIYTNGTEKWNFTTDGRMRSASPIIDSNGIIYIGNYNGSFYAVYPNGTQKWKVSLSGRFGDSTASMDSNGVIYIGNTESGNTLYAFDSQAPAPSFDPSGYVYYRDVDNSTRPLENALVKLNDTLYDYTDASGYYQIIGVPNGVYTLYVNHSDAFTTESKTISNAEPNNDFILKFIQGFRFVQLTDVHIGPDPLLCGFGDSESLPCLLSFITSIDRFKTVSDDIVARKPDFVLVTGDLVEWNSAFQYTAFNTLISKFKENNITVYIVPGNHDRRGKDYPTWDYPITNPFFPNNDLTNYKKYIGDGNNYDIRDNFFNLNDYQLIGLDSGHDPNFSLYNLPQLVSYPNGSGLSLEQINFISNNIIDGKSIIFMHHPAVDDSCLDNSCNVITENRDLFVALAKDKHVKLALTGHTHKSKFFDSTGKVSNTFNRYGAVTGTIPINSINTFINVNLVRSPLFIQTRSATKDEDALHGYLAVNVGGMSILKEEMSLVDVKMTGGTSAPVTILYLYSPADLHVYDESGRHTGLNATAGIENSIPDSYYFEEYKIGNTTLPAFVLLYNTTLNYSYELVSNFSRENITSAQATFNFTIEQKTQGAITTIKYNNVSINRDSKAYLRINTTQTNYTMQIDLNNDSIIDATKQPDIVENDYAPTATILSPADGSTWNQGQAMTFNGSGIDREDGTLNKLTWVSDRDDVIGHGNFTIANLSAGVHNIILLVNDTAGQVNTSNIVVTVRDTQPPVLNIEYPPENKIFNKQNITVRGFAYDDSGILNVTVNGLQSGKENWDAILSLNEGQNVINVTAIDNKGFSTTANKTVYYNSSLANDTEPPAAITNLTHKTGYDNVNRAWINWTWDNPRDADFSYVIIYLDNIRMENTFRSYFNISGLSSSANYTINIQSVDIVDNINLTEVKDTARTAEKDPPTTITSPEAIIKFDTSSGDFKVYNSETGAEVSFVELPSKLRQYMLRDGAGNTLSLVLKHKKAGNVAEINVISMEYNNGAIIETAKNTGRAEYSEKKGMLRGLQQKIEVKKLFDAGAKYSAKKGETEIRIKNEGQKEIKQTRAGIVMLELLTDNGSLKLKY